MQQVFIPISDLSSSTPDPRHSVSLAELDAEHSRKVLEMEHTQQMKLKERQKFFEEAFQQDMEQYLSTGYLQIAERRGKSRGGLLAAGAPWVCGDGIVVPPPPTEVSDKASQIGVDAS